MRFERLYSTGQHGANLRNIPITFFFSLRFDNSLLRGSSTVWQLRNYHVG